MIKVQMIGRVGGDPTTRQTAKGRPVANFNVAIHGEKDDKGEAKATWYPITCWDGRADIAEKVVRKGDLIWIEGTPQVSAWTDKNGVAHNDLNIHAKYIQVLSRSTKNIAEGNGGMTSKPAAPAEDLDEIPF
jgi:single-strand DNA-binding protein